MTFDQYQQLALRTAKHFNHLETDLVHAALGIATEGGEFTTNVKRAAIYDKPIDEKMRGELVEELGDLMWYVALACSKLNVRLELVCQWNIEKLQKRFPTSYSDQAAEARADKGGLDWKES